MGPGISFGLDAKSHIWESTDLCICPHLTLAQQAGCFTDVRVHGSGQQEAGPAPGACVRADTK